MSKSKKNKRKNSRRKKRQNNEENALNIMLNSDSTFIQKKSFISTIKKIKTYSSSFDEELSDEELNEIDRLLNDDCMILVYNGFEYDKEAEKTGKEYHITTFVLDKELFRLFATEAQNNPCIILD